MAGEIRNAMAQLRAAKDKMTSDMLAAINSVHAEIQATHADGLEAMKLPRAELDATKQEIREIRAEFAPQSNGAPAGPLPDRPNGSQQPSADLAEKKT